MSWFQIPLQLLYTEKFAFFIGFCCIRPRCHLDPVAASMFHLSREFFYRHVLPVGTRNPMLFMTRKTTSAFICLSRLSHKFSHSPLCYIQEADDCHLTSFFWSRNQHQHNQDVRKAHMVDGRSSTNTWRLELWKSSLDSSVKIPFSFWHFCCAVCGSWFFRRVVRRKPSSKVLWKIPLEPSLALTGYTRYTFSVWSVIRILLQWLLTRPSFCASRFSAGFFLALTLWPRHLRRSHSRTDQLLFLKAFCIEANIRIMCV